MKGYFLASRFVFLTILIVLSFPGNYALGFYYGDAGQAGPNAVHIGKTAIVMPLGYFLLLKRDAEYCAINFTKSWSENTTETGSVFVASGSDEYATYKSYYQFDKSGDFSKKNVEFKEGKLSSPKPRGIGRLAFSLGNKKIKCGPIKLFWAGKGSVYFYGEGSKTR